MAVKLIVSESGAIKRRLQEIRNDLDPKSRRVAQLRTEIKRAVVADNEDKLYRSASGMAGVDRYGRPLAKPAKSTVEGWSRKGLIKQILAPHGLSSRTITHFFVDWKLNGDTWQMVSGWRGIKWLSFHLQGAPPGSKSRQPNWSLPQRDIGGVTPAGFVQVRAAFRRYAEAVMRKTG
jgi:hypothetical protein